MKPALRKLLIAAAIILVVLVALVWWVLRGIPAVHSADELSGPRPILVEPQKEWFPSVALAKPVGWKTGEAPRAAEGLTVVRFAEGLAHPRTMLTLPNGDVLVAETNAPPGNKPSGLVGFFMGLFMDEVGAGVPSANRITLLRDADGDGRAEARFVLRAEGLSSPSGMAWAADKLYVANHDAVLAFDFVPGATADAGRVIYTDGDAVLSIPFDLSRLEASGPPQTVADGLITEAPGRPRDNDDERRRYYRITSAGRRLVEAETNRMASWVAAARAAHRRRAT